MLRATTRRLKSPRATPKAWWSQSLSHVQPFATPWTIACQGSLSMGFSRQEYWSGLPWPPPGDLPHPRIEPASLRSPVLAGRFFTTSTTWEDPKAWYWQKIIFKKRVAHNWNWPNRTHSHHSTKSYIYTWLVFLVKTSGFSFFTFPLLPSRFGMVDLVENFEVKLELKGWGEICSTLFQVVKII